MRLAIFSPDMTANYGVQNNEKETATRPVDSPVHSHIYTLCVGVKRGVTIISLLRALQLKLISDLKEMRRDRARSEERGGEKEIKNEKSHSSPSSRGTKRKTFRPSATDINTFAALMKMTDVSMRSWIR